MGLKTCFGWICVVGVGFNIFAVVKYYWAEHCTHIRRSSNNHWDFEEACFICATLHVVLYIGVLICGYWGETIAFLIEIDR